MHHEPLIELSALSKHYDLGGGWGRGGSTTLRAVDAVDLVIRKRETVGLVGESGSGKSTLGRLILHLTQPTSGSIVFEGQELEGALKSDMRRVRRRMQIVFQDPHSSLHPRRTVRQTLREAVRAGGVTEPSRIDSLASEMAHAVGLGLAHLDVYPFSLSGGQRQRVAIARALAVNPAFIVADEAVSALDVSIQAQILNLLADVQEKFALTYLFISHDLNVIRYLSDRVVVMYRGRIVEQAPTATLFGAAQHPYTRLLLSAMPGAKPEPKVMPTAAGTRSVPGQGCNFIDRCPLATAYCAESAPALTGIGNDHFAACHLAVPQAA